MEPISNGDSLFLSTNNFGDNGCLNRKLFHCSLNEICINPFTTKLDRLVYEFIKKNPNKTNKPYIGLLLQINFVFLPVHGQVSLSFGYAKLCFEKNVLRIQNENGIRSERIKLLVRT